jgi:hypothetical protein
MQHVDHTSSSRHGNPLLVRVVWLYVLFLLSLSIAFAPAQTQESAPDKAQVSSDELRRLIAELGHDDFKIREKAMKQLAEIGMPAFEAVLKATTSSDLEVQRRASDILEHFKPACVNGMEFKVIFDSEILVSSPGARVSKQVVLQVTNLCEDTLRFKLNPSLSLKIKDAHGKDVFAQGSLEQVAPRVAANVSNPLKKNQSHSIKSGLILTSHAFNHVSFAWEDPFGLCCVSPQTLSVGKFYVTIRFENTLLASDQGAPYWTGNVETVPKLLTVRRASAK